MMPNEIKTIVPYSIKPQIDEVSVFLESLAPGEQQSLLDFIQGARFMQRLMTASPARAEPERDSA